MADSKKYDGSQWEHSLRKLTTATEAVENPLYSDGTAITSYTLKGNTVQNGTPTPSNPVDVNGVGVRTANWYNIATAVGGRIDNGALNGSEYVTISSRTNTSIIFTTNLQARGIVSDYIAVPNGTENAYLSYNTNGITGNKIACFDSNKTFISDVGGSTFTNVTFSLPQNTAYLRVVITAQTADVEYTLSNLMLSYSNLSFIPYGYKIPISSGGVTTNIYLGSTQTVRAISKRVYNGSEDWRLHGSLANLFYLDDYQDGYADNTESDFAISNAFTQRAYIYVAGLSNGQFVYGTPSGSAMKRMLMKNTACSTVEEWQTWLASNPVTVWYILATPTTATINEPLMKIGDYADTLSNAPSIPTTEGANSITVDTTVQPSEFTATWTGWHDSSVKEWDGSDWQ